MTMTKTPTYARPGHPNGAHPLAVLAYLAALFGAGVLGWAALAGLVYLGWLVRVYFATGLAVLIASAVVALCVWLAVKGNSRARALAGGLFSGVVAFVLWVAAR